MKIRPLILFFFKGNIFILRVSADVMKNERKRKDCEMNHLHESLRLLIFHIIHNI